MAGATQTRGRQWSQTGDDAIRALVEEHNKLVDDLEALRAELVEESTSTMAEGDLTAGKIATREAGDP